MIVLGPRTAIYEKGNFSLVGKCHEEFGTAGLDSVQPAETGRKK